MYQLEMSLSVVGNEEAPTIERTIFHLSLPSLTPSIIVSLLTCVSQVTSDSLLPKDSQPGKPVEDQEQSTSGGDTYRLQDTADKHALLWKGQKIQVRTPKELDDLITFLSSVRSILPI